jgi:hypothetical protein
MVLGLDPPAQMGELIVEMQVAMTKMSRDRRC